MAGKPGESRMAQSEASRAGNRGVATGGGSKGRPGGMGTQRSVFTSEDGLSKGITVAVGPELEKKNAQRAATYNAAARQWNDSAETPSLANLVNNWGPMGFSMEPPDIARPSTFSGGDYHLAWNPGSLLGLASPIPGGGIALGAAGQLAYNALGGRNLVLGGEGDMGMSTWDAPGTGQPGSSTSGVTPGGGQLADRFSVGSFVMPKPTSLNAGNGQLAQQPSFAQNIQPGGGMPQGPRNLAELLKSLQQPTPPPGLGQFMGVI